MFVSCFRFLYKFVDCIKIFLNIEIGCGDFVGCLFSCIELSFLEFFFFRGFGWYLGGYCEVVVIFMFWRFCVGIRYFGSFYFLLSSCWFIFWRGVIVFLEFGIGIWVILIKGFSCFCRLFIFWRLETARYIGISCFYEF